MVLVFAPKSTSGPVAPAAPPKQPTPSPAEAATETFKPGDATETWPKPGG